MAKRGGESGCAVIALVVVGAIASVPKEVWVWVGIVVAVGAVIYWLVKSGGEPSSQSSPAPSATPTPQRYRYASEQTSQRAFSPSITAESCWRPPGSTAEVGGHSIPNAAIYVGQGLGNVVGNDVEPALIDPTLSVEAPAGFFESLGYWPSYSRISARARGRYLLWLAGGRRDPATDIGYVFLFFYGLERRMLADNRADNHMERELPWMRHEVARLLSLYGSSSGSFQRYATGFLEFLSLAELSDEASAYDGPAPEPGERRRMGLRLMLGLGRAAAEGKPVRGDWAYSWLMSDERVTLRTAAQRCGDQFRELFMLVYREMYGDGMTISPPKTKLKAVYRPASSSFGHRSLELAFDEIPDVSVTEAPLRKLINIAERATEMLGPYSRFIARDGARADSLAALLLLPPALWPDEHVARLGKWLSDIGADRSPTAVGFGELIRHFPTWEDMSRDRVGAFSKALESLGVGIEPDVRWGGAMLEETDPVVLFPLDKHERSFEPTSLYKAAALTIHLAAVVTIADGTVSIEEEKQLEAQIERWPDLSPSERKRLRAFVKWLLLAKPSLTGLKRLTKELDDTRKRGIAQFLVHVAQAEGSTSPKELKALGKIYRLLGLNEEELYGHAHAAATEPVTVKPAMPTDKRYAIPQRPAVEKAAALDERRLEALKRESEEVSELLAGIFAESGAVEPVPEPEDAGGGVATSGDALFAGLDAEQLGFAKLVMGRSLWTRAELEDLAEDRNVMLDGALERINEAALDRFNEPLFEGADPIEVNPNVLKEIAEHGHHQTERT
ncbi:MAG: TerB N-terminal domain-containing protein [Betaproteobacteria bacterium]|nr:TerB N-terminal domain-containing protein [Betaproteobacteria bacterium]